MVTLPPAPQCLKVRIIGTTQGAPFVHVLHGQYSGTRPNSGDLNTVATAIRAAWQTNFAPMLNTLTSVNAVEVTDLTDATGAQGTNSSAFSGTGGTPTSLPRSACGVVSWKQTLHYRGGHPRTYIPLRTQADLQNSFTLTSTYVTALAAAGKAFITAFNAIPMPAGGSLTLVMVSYFHNKGTLRPAGTPFPIVDATSHNRLDSQRRRLGKEF